ncbi:MAG: hypothetical protein GWN62_33595 [Aliifodinibius sp.]|nr:hypothetical protein [Fodinibius sp.]
MERKKVAQTFLIRVVGFGLFFLASCSSNIAKVSVQDVGEYQLSFYHQGGEIELWSDFDMEFKEPIDVFYQISFYQNEELVREILCDPFSVEEKRMTRFVELDDLVKVSFLGKMVCSVSLLQGETVSVVSFYAEAEDLEVFRADLILK